MKMMTIQFNFSGKVDGFKGEHYFIVDHNSPIILDNIEDYDPKRIMVVFPDPTVKYAKNTQVRIKGFIELHRVNNANYVKFVGEEVVAID